ncbi:MAG: hypothetical protein LBO05_10990 [Deltaproteobacteria bacterium]|jgi:hypothetical protein|nr:hypothetical protein [Deltaproteobacteria bacterium]
MNEQPKRSVFQNISDDYKSVFKGSVFIAPNIPDKKMNGAIKGVSRGALSPNQVLLIYDSAIFGGAAEGRLLTQ